MKRIALFFGIIVAIIALISMASCESRSGKIQSLELTIPVSAVTSETHEWISFEIDSITGLVIRRYEYKAYKGSVERIGKDSLHVKRAYVDNVLFIYDDVLE